MQEKMRKEEKKFNSIRKRSAKEFSISDEEFDAFIARHKSQKVRYKRLKLINQSLVPESNKSMKNSYLILDERMRFLNCTNNGKEPTESLLDGNVVQNVY